jgi:hypothetical protein
MLDEARKREVTRLSLTPKTISLQKEIAERILAI